MQIKIKTLLLHCIAWSVFLIIAPVMVMRPGESFSFYTISPFLLAFLYLISFFYLNINVLIPKLLSNKKYFLYAGAILFIIALYLLIQVASFHHFQSLGNMPPPHFPEKRPFMKKPNSIFSFRFITLPLFQVSMFFILSLFYKMTQEWIYVNRRNKEIEAEKLEIELALLKAQINPHFFFNALNTLYALTLNKSEKAEEAILLFSQIVRYVLNKSDESFVELKEEIDYLTDYIKLQKMRYSDILNVNFETRGDIKSCKITPSLVIPFIENSFKYGISAHYPSQIDILLEVLSNGTIYFCIKNQIYKTDKKQYSGMGIGITNTQKRLNLLYPQKHQLLIDQTETSFCVELYIGHTEEHK